VPVLLALPANLARLFAQRSREPKDTQPGVPPTPLLHPALGRRDGRDRQPQERWRDLPQAAE
jgi:hypothetical protein